VSQAQIVLKAENIDPQITWKLQLTLIENKSLDLINWILQANQTSETLTEYREKASKERKKNWQLQDGLILYKNWLVIPEDNHLWTELIQETHEQLSMVHLRQNKTCRLISAWYYWPNLSKDIAWFIRNCHTCQQTMISRDLPSGPLQPLLILERLWQHIAMDFKSFSKDKKGYDAVYVVTNHLEKRAYSIPCHKTITAKNMT